MTERASGCKINFLAGHVFSGITKHFDSRLAWQSKSRGSKAAPDVKEINEAKKRARHSKADGGFWEGEKERKRVRDWDLAALSKRRVSSSFVESYVLPRGKCMCIACEKAQALVDLTSRETCKTPRMMTRCANEVDRSVG